jgi:subtilisin family serine protease
MKFTFQWFTIFILLWAQLLAVTPFQAEASETASPLDNQASNEGDGWIIKWNQQPREEWLETSEVIAEYPELNVTVATPREGYDPDEWLEKLEQSSHVKYIQRNHKVHIASSRANDPYRVVQSYLNQIQIERAWDRVRSNKDITIALIDTGIDLTHPDLKSNIIPGINLLDKTKPPQDDNGHGTNVAGVIAAAGNNKQGISGILWEARIMPIKALEADGSGNEDQLGAGIRYAVDQGAKIVVLSLGLYRYTPFMLEVVQYAEDHGVLLVAASGNEGKDIKYPAAYPTVLAVGGIKSNNELEPKSNYGPELDLVAPWDVYTTSGGGGYNYNEGTSMAAPQVAAVAALIWSQNPNMKHHEIRNLLRQTAQDIGDPGWDYRTGYGLLRADRALTQLYRTDIYEPNDQQHLAKPLPIDTVVSAELSSVLDRDWFELDVPYDGTVKLHLKTELAPPPKVNLAVIRSDGLETAHPDFAENGVTLDLKKGKHFIQLALADKSYTRSITYNLESSFTIYRDSFEDNDRQFRAYSLPARSQKITGTFHQIDDQDWFVINLEKSGLLRAEVSVTTARIDPEISIQKVGEKALVVDMGLAGATEYTPSIEVHPGKYYIRVKNVVGDKAYPVGGEYSLKLDYSIRYIDPNEPNNKPFQATMMAHDTNYTGVFDQNTDIDFFSFKLLEERYVHILLNGIPDERIMLLQLRDQDQNQIAINVNSNQEQHISVQQALGPGTYYIRLSSDRSFRHQMYNLKLSSEKLEAGFRDISDHWAKKAIIGLTQQKIISGYTDYTFRPYNSITRAEAAAMIVRAFKINNQGKINYSDVSSQHWAFDSISKATNAGISVGYPDGKFMPEQRVTRAEMAVMVARALKIQGTAAQENPFKDVSGNHWAASILTQLKQEKLLVGYKDGSFKPEGFASRAEFSSFLSVVLDYRK